MMSTVRAAQLVLFLFSVLLVGFGALLGCTIEVKSRAEAEPEHQPCEFMQVDSLNRPRYYPDDCRIYLTQPDAGR